MGAWDPDTGTIWIAHGLSQAERRSTVTHESVHAERGDEACCTEWHESKQERLVNEAAARRLIPTAKLVDALLWTLDESELAEDLWVDLDTVRTRLATLTAAEKADIDLRLRAAERNIA
jgi:Zn-dependent peptidase ImmA (M78 family)